MKALSRLLIVLLMLGAGGCAGKVGPTVAPSGDITGKGVGAWAPTSAVPGSGTIGMAIRWP